MEKYFVNVIILFNMRLIIRGEELRNATRTDLLTCKLTQTGTEYKGSIMTTAGGIRCQSWSQEEMHKVSSDIRDFDFPEGSLKEAKNYCRNPTSDSRGPWCYTTEENLIDDDCGILLCNYGECRITGIGAEYGGTRKISSSGKKCKSWDKRHKLADSKSTKFPNKNFPDDSRDKANNFCRNPSNDPGGPWCYVEEENYEIVEKEYCDIPFCDDKDCLTYARNASAYSTMTRLNSTLGGISIWLKLLNPNDERKGEARILFSLISTPTTSEKIARDWRAGVELIISNFGTGQIYPNDGEKDFENTPGILTGSEWTGIDINWGGGFISLGMHGSAKPIFIDEYKKKFTISNLYPESFLYYGFMGTGILWSTEFCQSSCEEHLTFGLDFVRIWPLQRSNATFDVHFFVRASHSIVLRLYQSPGASFPYFTLLIEDNEAITLTYQQTEHSMKEYLKDIPAKGLLDYWSWKEFTLSIFGLHLRLFSQKVHGNEEILYVKHTLFSTLRWFSVGSDKTMAHWTFFCSPAAQSVVEDPWPPNCMANPADYLYEGSQWTSLNEIPCAPWVEKEVPDELKVNENFPDGSHVKALNKCRNPTKDPDGPFCYAILDPKASRIEKHYCPIRSCRSSECRMAGTANDYVGTLSTTRSGRTCAKWLSDYEIQQTELAEKLEATTIMTTPRRAVRPRLFSNKKPFVPRTQQDILMQMKPVAPRPIAEKPGKPPTITVVKPVHTVNRKYLNDSLYPEFSVRNASNYCRDPSRNIAGTWCYTNDPAVPQDLCNVRDCEKPEECTFLVKGHGIGRRLYVLPEHRSEGLHFSLKAWEPDEPDSITFVFLPEDGFRSRYILKIGALDNEKVLLFYQSEYESIKLVKKKTLPHLLYLGKWSSFVIQIPRGRILLFYEGSTDPIFLWEHPDPVKAFLPVYYYYNSERGRTIGVAFDCSSRCHIENTQTERYTRILPVSMWSKREVRSPDTLVLMLRGKGVILLPLLMLPASRGFYALTIGEQDGRWTYFMENDYPNVRIFHKQKSSLPLFVENSWTNITVRWSGKIIDVFANETPVFHYEHRRPLIFYFFSLAVDPGGWATWAANCVPTDIDGPPVDGGWSEWGPWACSASCNGGVGSRKRVCDSPEPNVRGEPCLGPSTMTGRCNMILCGDITEDTVTLVKRRMQRNFTSLEIKEGQPVTIMADVDIVERLKDESEDADIKWSLNGIYLEEEEDEDRISIKNYDIVISKAFLNDSGVYTITFERVDGTRMIFKVVTLAVLPLRESLTIRKSLAMSVTCRCVILGYVYSDLKIRWTIENETWKDYGITLPVAVNVDHIPAVNESHSGMWKCIVEQNDLQFKWTTNAILVRVLGPPNWRTHLMEDKFTRPIFGWMPSEEFVAVAALVIFLLLTIIIIVCSMLFVRYRESLKMDVSLRRKDDGSFGAPKYRQLEEEHDTESLTIPSEPSESTEVDTQKSLLKSKIVHFFSKRKEPSQSEELQQEKEEEHKEEENEEQRKVKVSQIESEKRSKRKLRSGVAVDESRSRLEAEKMMSKPTRRLPEEAEADEEGSSNEECRRVLEKFSIRAYGTRWLPKKQHKFSKRSEEHKKLFSNSDESDDYS
ncbi:uncharacterized protein [Prorops nasuta]|uniref:uncharacterized protein n=1 Tax=Prorops nasuta TaxID=863751 RepID=UPI0034CDA85F